MCTTNGTLKPDIITSPRTVDFSSTDLFYSTEKIMPLVCPTNQTVSVNSKDESILVKWQMPNSQGHDVTYSKHMTVGVHTQILPIPGTSKQCTFTVEVVGKADSWIFHRRLNLASGCQSHFQSVCKHAYHFILPGTNKGCVYYLRGIP